MTKTLKTLLMASGMSLALAGAANAQSVYALGQGGGSLVDFSADSDGDAFAIDIVTTEGEAIVLDAITYRPEAGIFYGYSDVDSTLYELNQFTGEATAVFSDPLLPGGIVEFDVNPNLDAFRFVSASGDNVVYFPENSSDLQGRAGTLLTATTTPDAITNLSYGEGYDADGIPQLVGTGYTNQLRIGEALDADDDLLQFTLDATTDTLGVLNNNAGTVDFVAAAGFDFDFAGGFDVYSEGDFDLGYAFLTVDGQTSLYTIDLASYVFTRVFDYDGTYGDLDSLVVFNVPMDAVPLPAAALLFPLGAAALGAARRRKTA